MNTCNFNRHDFEMLSNSLDTDFNTFRDKRDGATVESRLTPERQAEMTTRCTIVETVQSGSTTFF